jgi:hypothetical protein
MLSAEHEGKMSAPTINIIGALKAQQDQLKRLLDQKMWISATPKATLDEMEDQIRSTKALVSDLEAIIKQQRARQ